MMEPAEEVLYLSHLDTIRMIILCYQKTQKDLNKIRLGTVASELACSDTMI